MKRFVSLVLLLLATSAPACKGHKYNSDDYILNPGALDHILSITADRAVIPADGFTRTAIRAQITPGADPTLRTVKFTTTAGTLVAHEIDTEVDIVADAAGVAVIHLQSDRTLRTAVVRAQVGGIIRETQVAFVSVNPSDIITLVASPLTAPADGRSAARLVASVASTLPADRKRVQFASTLGTFAESNDDTYNPPFTINDQASADLRSREVGTARVTAQVDGIGAEVQVQFTTARPEQIVVSTQRFFVPANDSQVEVTARLLRAIGVATEGQVVTFTAETPTGLTVGHFSNVQRSNADGIATALFSAQGVTYRGPVRIAATVGAVSGTVMVEIVNP